MPLKSPNLDEKRVHGVDFGQKTAIWAHFGPILAEIDPGTHPGTHRPEGLPGVGLTPGLTHLAAGPGYPLTVSPG